MDKAPKTLTSIFADTDNVTYGPFAILKNTGQGFKQARFMVDGTEVPLEAAQKKIMALLISQQGKTLTVLEMAQGMETEKFDEIAEDIQNPESSVIRQQALRKGHRNYGTHISYIREALIDKFGAGTPETIRYLAILETVKGYSIRPALSLMKSGYRLNIGEPAADLQ